MMTNIHARQLRLVTIMIFEADFIFALSCLLVLIFIADFRLDHSVVLRDVFPFRCDVSSFFE